MKKFLVILVVAFLRCLAIGAQGTVTVTQSEDIDALVNGKKNAKINKKKQQPQSQGTVRKPSMPSISTPRVEPRITPPDISSSPNTESYPRTKLVRKKVRRALVDPIDGTAVKQTVTKRVWKGIKKVRGFRVLAYSGGNTRVARQEAERWGQKAKEILQTEPIYVHFYSPRWMCQIGNYTSYEQARKVMRRLKKEGFTQANVIRTMVTIETTKVIGDTYDMDY